MRIKYRLGVMPGPVYCTKIVSKLVRTYTDRHGLKDLCAELIGVDLSKQQQSSDWGAETLTDEQLRYAAADVLHLHRLKEKLDAMLAREGRTLYAMDSAGTLSIIDASGPAMLARGSLSVPQAGGTLFVGDGIAYATARQSLDGGFATVDVSDLDAPALISGPDVTGEAPDRAIAVNAGRVALLVGLSGGFDAVDVMDVTDPTETDVFRTRLLLPEAPQGVALASGAGFVADGDAGLRVVGYQATDVAGQAPVISIEALVRDVDPVTAGIQVIAGQAILVVADTADDVDVRDVALLVNGTAAGRGMARAIGGLGGGAAWLGIVSAASCTMSGGWPRSAASRQRPQEGFAN